MPVIYKYSSANLHFPFGEGDQVLRVALDPNDTEALSVWVLHKDLPTTETPTRVLRIVFTGQKFEESIGGYLSSFDLPIVPIEGSDSALALSYLVCHAFFAPVFPKGDDG